MTKARAWERRREKRTLLSEDEEWEIKEFMAEARETLGFGINFSELTRAAWTVMLQNDTAILTKLDRARNKLHRPETQDPEAGLEFEYLLADIIEKAVRAGK